MSGTLQRSEAAEGGTTLELLLDDGTTCSYLVGPDVPVTRNGSAIALSALAEGERLTLTVEAGEVRAVAAEKGQGVELSGTALYVNTSDQTILLRTSGGTIVTVDVPISASILEGETQGRLGLRNLRSGDTLRLTGTYREDLTFLAETVVRE